MRNGEDQCFNRDVAWESLRWSFHVEKSRMRGLANENLPIFPKDKELILDLINFRMDDVKFNLNDSQMFDN